MAKKRINLSCDSDRVSSGADVASSYTNNSTSPSTSASENVISQEPQATSKTSFNSVDEGNSTRPLASVATPSPSTTIRKDVLSMAQVLSNPNASARDQFMYLVISKRLGKNVADYLAKELGWQVNFGAD